MQPKRNRLWPRDSNPEPSEIPGAVHPILTIEHENDNGIQDEVWKLACWRSRLKVLITYHDNEAQQGEKRVLAADIIGSIQSGNDETEWLLLSAPRTWGERLAWTAHEWNESAWHALSAE